MSAFQIVVVTFLLLLLLSLSQRTSTSFEVDPAEDTERHVSSSGVSSRHIAHAHVASVESQC